MKKSALIIFLLLLMCPALFAAHIKGGFFTYQYLGAGSGNSNRYKITLTVYMICNPSSGQLSNPINFTFFNAGTNQYIRDVSVAISNQYTLNKTYDEPCITGNEVGCKYTIVIYNLESIELPALPEGYVVSYQRCCRLAGINNLINSGAAGNTFSIKIPGSVNGQNIHTNNSPQFLVNDTGLVCKNNYFQLNFSATDPDGDSLSYEFCEAYDGGSQSNPSPITALSPPYNSVPYGPTFSGTQPLGNGVTINAATGLISGIAPSMVGQYVICVCVNEYRNGVLIATTRKELHLEVSDCSPLGAQLNPRPSFCEGLTVNFQNDGGGNDPTSIYQWNFGDPASGSNNISTLATPSHTYSAPGDYTVKLKVTIQGVCTDSTTTNVRVWPGFYPGFSINGICLITPFQFLDTTSANHGQVDFWRWNFGDNSTLADTSILQNPQWTYTNAGTVTVTLIVGSSKGCIDTVQQVLNVLDKPVITLGFNDTLICKYDSIRLSASGNGSFTWHPNTHIINTNTANPIVFPVSTSWYYVNLENAGCVNKDSVKINVTPNVFINSMPDSTICQGDTIQLRIASNGLQYRWTPAMQLNDSTLQSPLAITPNTTTYQVVGIVGSCSATKQITIKTTPYPLARISPDTLICFNGTAALRGTSNGNRYTWIPAQYLSNPSSLTPIARPPNTQRYVLAVYDTLGCPKPGLDTVTITVLPQVIAKAGRDTTAVIGQPLQFNASGGVYYNWSPATGLSSTTIADPIGIYSLGTNRIRYRLIASDSANCADTSYINVRVFQTPPNVFVPTAFTPNNDGKNDIVKPVLAGIKELKYFRILNRWGQVIFETKQDGIGWDGRINGQPQSTSIFVWAVSGIDYLDQPYFAKGIITLIR
jgi:gliding motility-associated-like protein